MRVLASSLFDPSVSALFTCDLLLYLPVAYLVKTWCAECTCNVNWLNCKILKVYVSKCNLLMICIT